MADVAELAIEVTMQGAQRAIDDLKDIAAAGRVAEEQATSLIDTLKTLAGMWVVKEMAEATVAIAQMGARYEMLGATMGVMANNVGMYKNELDAIQASMEKTGITALEARKGLQVMAAAQVDMSKASALARVAQDAATIAGINSSQAFDNLVRGIATGESRIIRHMGIMVNYKKAITDYAEANGKAASSLTAQEIAQARLNSTLEEGKKRAGVYEEAMTTAGKQILSMQRYVDNLKVEIGETFNPATNALVFALVEALKTAKEWMEAWEDSGEKAVFMNKLAQNMQNFISIVKDGLSFLWDHKTAIEAIAIAWGSLKFAEYAAGFIRAAAAMYGASLQGQAMMINEARNRIALTAATLAQNEARQLELALERAKHMNWIRSQAVWAEEAALIRGNTILYDQLTAAKERLAVAEGGGAKAVSMFSSAVTALGGPVVVIIGLLTAAAAAWYMFANKEQKAQQDNDAAMQAELDRIQKETSRKQMALKLLNEGRTEEAERIIRGYAPIVEMQAEEAAAIRAKLLPQKEYLALVEKTAALESKAAENGGLSAMGVQSQVAAGLLAEQNRMRERAVYLEERVLEARTNANILAVAEQELEKKRIEMARSGGKDPDAMKEKDSWFNNFVIATEKKIGEERIKTLNLGKEQTAELKAQNEYSANMARIDEHIIELAKAKKAVSASAVDAARVAVGELRKAEEESARAAQEAASQAADGKMLDSAMKKLKEMNKEVAEGPNPAISFGEAELASIGLTKAVWGEVEAYKWLVATLNEAHVGLEKVRTEKKLIAAGESMNKSKAEDDAQLSRLNEISRLVKLLPGVYERAWLDIMMKGDSATAIMVQSAKSAFNNLENAFVTFVTTGKASFKSLMQSIAADLARLYASRAFQQLFLMMAPGGPSPLLAAVGGNTLPQNANGGNITGPSIVGEKGPEIFIPNGFGTIVPNSALSGGTAVQNTIIVQVSSDGSTKTSSESNKKGNSIGKDLEAMMDSWARKNFRPGGQFNQYRTN